MTEDNGADLRFVNLRERAGWSADAAKAGPKMAALAAAAAEPMPGIPFVQIESAGVLLVYGRACGGRPTGHLSRWPILFCKTAFAGSRIV